MTYPYQIKSLEEYKKVYQHSIEDPAGFWEGVANHFTWKKKWKSKEDVLNWNFTEPKIEWFKGATLNITENCLDRHLIDQPNQPAIIWEPNSPDEQSRILTYKKLHEKVCQFAHVLKNNAPKGLTIKPAAKVAKVDSKAAVGFVFGKN